MRSLLIKCLEADPNFISNMLDLAKSSPKIAYLVLTLLEKLSKMPEGAIDHKELISLIKTKVSEWKVTE